MKAPDFDSIFEKNFHELTPAERAEMQDLFSTEDEFNQMKFVLNSVNATILQQQKQAGPSAEVKNRLDHLYTETYRNKGILWYNSVGAFFVSSEKKWHQQNLIRIAALFILFFTIYPFWNSSSLHKEKVQLSQNDKIQEEAAPQENKAPRLKDSAKQAESPKTGEETVHSFDVSAAALQEETADAEMVSDEMSVAFTPFEDQKPTVATLAGSTHPDGVFMNDQESDSRNREFSAARHSDVLDILTATY